MIWNSFFNDFLSVSIHHAENIYSETVKARCLFEIGIFLIFFFRTVF